MIRALFSLTVAAFVLNLPFSKTAFGARLRQIAAFAFLLALLPSIICGLFFPSPSPGADTSAPPSGWEQITSGLSCFGAIVLLPFIAYGVLAVRKKLRKPKKEPWEMLFSRGGGKASR